MTNALMASAVDPDVSAALQIYNRLNPLREALGLQKDITDGELQVFCMVAHYTGLDPFTKQIYAIKRGGKVTHQTGIDGYRSVAERTRHYAGSEEATFEGCDCGEAESPKDHPRLARVIVRKVLPDGRIVEQPGVARWHELKPAHFKPAGANDYLDAMWWKQPYNQLSKCAEANGLRKAFPRVFAGVYLTDEMQGAETIEGEATEVPAKPPTVAERIAAKRAAVIKQDEAAVSTGEAAPASSSEQPTADPSAATPCAMSSPYGEDATCVLPTGHAGNHRSESRESWV